jgi:murein L,D-transpeptidase YcbB/YkuD
MSEYPKNPGPLPAEKLCNKYNNPNPIKGEGALGNETKGKMYYEGKGDKKSLVETLQTMLRDLKKYDLGSFGPNNDGVDGTFGNSTEDAVKQFQKEHKDWDGNALKVDGLVGPETADALNREMVDIWYDHYQTPVELVEGVPYHTTYTKHQRI